MTRDADDIYQKFVSCEV